MKKIPLLFITILSIQIFLPIGRQAFSQGGIWTWISGSNLLADNGIYGTQGMPSINNRPPANYEYVEWKDNAGNFWIYGGTFPPLSDLWKFNPQTLEWTWVKGNALSSQVAIYGTQGVSDPLNTPGMRAYGATTWIDTSGNLWLFGGDAPNGMLNDIWKYDISINEWTWMKGDTIGFALGNHGIQGVPGPNVNPGARCETSIGWIDTFNNLWLFGGSGVDDVGVGYGILNDVMKYDVNTNEWTWMNGSNLGSAAPIWGIKNIPSAMNDPGGRCSYSHWTDIQGGFWLMGGVYFSTTSFYLNDVWRLDPGTNIWTWKAGTDVFNDTGHYQTMCTFNSLNIPYSRLENRSGVQDNCGRHWFYGGTNGNDTDFVLNDLWIFDPYTLEYAWIWGTNFPNPSYNFGTLGVPSSMNNPSCRTGPSTWWGNDNRFYMFGGLYAVFPGPNWVSVNDMWVFTPDSTCIGACQPSASATLSSDSICPGTCIDFINLSSYASSFQWLLPGANPSSSTDVNPQSICYANPGSFDVTLIAMNSTDIDTLVLPDYIYVFPQPSSQSITQIGDTLFALPGASFYQWYFNGSLISGATNYYYIATASGDYNVVATDGNGCEVEAVINNVIADVTPFSFGEGLGVRLYPNPVTEKLYISSYELNGTADAEISIYNVMGEKVISESVKSEANYEIDVHDLPSGLYYIEFISERKLFRTKFIKSTYR